MEDEILMNSVIHYIRLCQDASIKEAQDYMDKLTQKEKQAIWDAITDVYGGIEDGVM